MTNYYDDTAISGQSVTYMVVTVNSAGTASTNCSPTGTNVWAPAPTLTNNAWLIATAITEDDVVAYDQATLSWGGPATNASPISWYFQTSEFGDVPGFINELSGASAGTLAAFLWTNSTSQRASLYALSQTQTIDIHTLTNALNSIIGTTQDGQNGSVYTAARFPSGGASLRSATQALLSSGTAPQPQLNRMLLDDFFQADYFTRGPNWGSNLTGFRIYYRTVLYANGQKIEQTSRQDLSLSDVTLLPIFRTLENLSNRTLLRLMEDRSRFIGVGAGGAHGKRNGGREFGGSWSTDGRPDFGLDAVLPRHSGIPTGVSGLE